jgi:SNF2 family DNA or RNA helicase
MNLEKYNKAIESLKNYNGDNDYIIGLREKWRFSKNFQLNEKDVKYILDNFNVKPIFKNKLVPITTAFSLELQSKFEFDYAPEKIFVYKVLVHYKKQGLLHCFGKLNLNHKKNYCFNLYLNQIKQERSVNGIDLSKYKERPPKEFQKEGIYKLVKNKRFILADEMGTGKSIMSTLAALECGFEKILIVCPASMKYTWKKEISFYEPESKISVIENTKDWKSNKWVIVNYDIINKFISKEKNYFYDEMFECCILDEAHKVKNKASKRSKAANEICKNIDTVWLLTGTPITNKPIDYFHLLEIVNSPLSNNWKNFVKKYCEGKKINLGYKSFWKTDGASNLEDLKEKTSDVILRRKKEDILDLPDKITTPIHLQFSKQQESLYNGYKKEFKEFTENQENNNIAVQLTELVKLRTFLAKSKVVETIAIAEDAIEAGNKVIIFSCFADPIARFENHFDKKCVKIDGSVSNQNRKEAEQQFQENENVKVFIGQIQAAGEGLTLTAANTVIFNDLDWSPSMHNQASDRAHRISQNDKVNVMYPIFANTLDEMMFDKLIYKQQNIDEVLGDPSQSLSGKNMVDFIEQIKEGA